MQSLVVGAIRAKSEWICTGGREMQSYIRCRLLKQYFLKLIMHQKLLGIRLPGWWLGDTV